MDLFANDILSGAIDDLNLIVGIEKCNYYSNLFSFNKDSTEDLSDPMFPKSFNPNSGTVDW